MNITPQPQSVTIATSVNIPTDTLRRENNIREVIAKPEAMNQAAAEKGAASERERAKTPGQSHEGIDFEALRKQAEEKDTTINGDSKEGHSQHSRDQNPEQNPEQHTGDESAHSHQESASTNGTSQQDAAELAQDQQELDALQARDREVRAHELAHAAVGGSTTGAPSYTFQTGPDGRQYAVGGEVSVDLSPVSGDSSATIAKMQRVKAAALAPASPSSQDLRVAATATKMIAQEQAQLAIELNQKKELAVEGSESSTPADHTHIDKVATEQGNTEQSSTASTRALAEEAFSRLSKTVESVDVFSEKIEVDFDALIERTLAAQASSERPADIEARAGRIESFYDDITQAYDKLPSYQFTLAI